MKIAVASDIHGSLTAARAFFDQAAALGAPHLASASCSASMQARRAAFMADW